MAFLDTYEVVLLDMCNTFIFDSDDFTDTADFAATYLRIGGSALKNTMVQKWLREIFDTVLADYENPACYDNFPRIGHYFNAHPDVSQLPQSEKDKLIQVFAEHEGGTVLPAYAEKIQQLANSHRVGVISNIWSDPEWFLPELERSGVSANLEHLVFSTAVNAVKPSPKIFEKTLELFAVSAEKTLFIGDSFRCDVAGSQGVGMDAVWLNAKNKPLPPNASKPALIIENLLQL